MTTAPAKPNIVYVLCDDLGYGDVQAFNPTRGKIKTPCMDSMASEGMLFTDMHSSSAVCTPSRYGILTGRYAWRTHLQSGVLWGLSEPLIARAQLTVPEMLRENGYATAAIGKWHLGLEFGENKYVDPITDGPLQHGFDYYFGISASLDMPPFVYIENDHFVTEPTVEKRWVRSGPAAEDFEAIHVLPDFTRRAVAYIEEQAPAARDGQPFFLYLALAAPHTPILPTPEWEGKSGLGPYGDFVMQVDASLGELMQVLQTAGIADNTLLIFTSDNGCAPAAGVDQLEAQGHYPSADLRGYKADIWDGGHRIPFILRWPNQVRAGTTASELYCLTDLMATCAEIIGAELPTDAGEDSVSLLPALQQEANDTRSAAVVHHSLDGYFAIRRGQWKLELCAGSGGWAAPREYAARQQNLPPIQLYDMSADIGEKINVADQHPEIVQELTELLDTYIENGRSTPGPLRSNDAPINLHKEPKPPAPPATRN